MRPVLFAAGVGLFLLSSLVAPRPVFAQAVRYFAVWSYVENAPREEIAREELADRTLGYWELEFDAEGAVHRAIYHGSSGAVWLSFTYVQEGGRVFADLFNASGAYLSRKSTQLADRTPHWPDED